MKKPIVIVVLLVIIGLIVWSVGGNKDVPKTSDPVDVFPPSVSAPVSETTKVSDKLSLYKNEELGFSVKYPSVWEAGVSDTGVSFVIPYAKDKTNTMKRLDSKILVTAGKCAFPPVTTISDRAIVKSGDLSFNTISMKNSVQGSNYFDRMYSLQKESICYLFSLSSITASPASSGIKGSEATQVANNNKAIVEAADQAFTTMVKSFAYVIGAVGQDEAIASPKK